MSDPKPAPKRKGGRKPKLDPELVAAALVEMLGNVAATAKRFGVHRSSLQELIDKRPSLQQIVKDAREGIVDHAESALTRAVIQGEAWAVCFTLKTQGKSRGYVERVKDSEGDTMGELLRELIRERVSGATEQDRGAPEQPGGVGGGGPAADVADAPAPQAH